LRMEAMEEAWKRKERSIFEGKISQTTLSYS
jgi:hypothetical protein